MHRRSSRKVELAWAAGFYDGEGTICFTCSKQLSIIIGQVEKEPLLHFRRAVGAGKVAGPYKKKKPQRPMFFYRLQTSKHVIEVMDILWPFMSPFRKRQARNAITAYKRRDLKRKPGVCPAGHKHRDMYISPDGGRECALCKKIRRKKYMNDCPKCGRTKVSTSGTCRSCWNSRGFGK